MLYYTRMLTFVKLFKCKYVDIEVIDKHWKSSVCLTFLQPVENVLAGAIRREIAMYEFYTKQHTEIMQLNRLVPVMFL